MMPKSPITKRNVPLSPETERIAVRTEKKVQASDNKKTKKGSFSLWSILRGEFLVNERSVKYLPFLMFLASLAMVYIANAYYVERKVVKIQQLTKRVKDLHTNYVSVKADLMFSMKQTEIARKMQESGLMESVTPPNVIRINKKELEIY